MNLQEFVKNKNKVDLVIANMVTYSEFEGFYKGIKYIIKPNGVISIEFPHLLNMINENQFDTVYHDIFLLFIIFNTKNFKFI